MIGRKGCVQGWQNKSGKRCAWAQPGYWFGNCSSENRRGRRNSRVAVKCVDIWKNTGGEGAVWSVADTEARKRGEQIGLDTLVVHAVNDEN